MAVYTDVAAEDLSAFLADYALGNLLSLKGIAEGVENSNYFVMTETGPFILTLYEKRVNADDLPFFLGLMEHLAERGVPCPTPIRDRNGVALKTLNGRPATLISFLTGVSPRRVTVDQCSEVGRSLADLHLKGADFAIKRPNALSLEGWPALAHGCAKRADEVEPGLARELETEIAAMEQGWPGDLPAGVIHADLFCDNVFFDSGRLSGMRFDPVLARVPTRALIIFMARAPDVALRLCVSLARDATRTTVATRGVVACRAPCAGLRRCVARAPGIP